MAANVPPVISRTAQYALQALVCLASHETEEPMLGQTIAEEMGIPQNYLSKILRTLGRAGIVEAKRGKQGGYSLTAPPGSLRLRDLLGAFDDMDSLGGCLLGLEECSDSEPCLAHLRWQPIAEALREFLEDTTLAEFTQRPGHGVSAGGV